jgi:D-alanyl-D-alanine carboxypeptidase
MILAALASVALQERASVLAVGDPAPPFAIERALHGAPPERLEPGRVYVVEFWAAWCGPCIAGMSHLSALQRELGPRGLTVVGVGPRPDEWGHDEAAVAALVARKGPEIEYALALDAEGDSAEGWQGVFRGRTIEGWMGAAEVGAIPIAFVVDRDGRIAAIAPPLEIDAVVRACLDGTFDRERAAFEYRALRAARAGLDELRGLLVAGERALAATLTAELLEGPLWSDGRHLAALAERWLAAAPTGEELELALRAARRADELTQGSDPGTLCLVARLASLAGDKTAAARARAQALALAEGPFRAALERDLAALAEPIGRVGATPELQAPLDELARAYVDAGELSGVVLVARGDEVLLRAAYGFADAERGIPNAVDTRFHVASLTKTFTAAAVLLLAQDGALALADPIARFLPDYPRGGDITIEHLLLHQAGLPDHHGVASFEERTRGPMTTSEVVALVRDLPLEFEPGAQHRYSNSGYALLAHVVEVASETPFDELVRARLLAPLDMDRTGPAPAQATAPERALGHDPGPPPRGMERVPARDWSYTVGSGALESTVDDLHRWLRALDARRPVDVFASSWPYGWGKRDLDGHAAIEQTGMHSGFVAAMTLFPAENLYVVTLSNVLATGAWSELNGGLARIALGLDVDWPERAPAVVLADADAARLAGRYAHPDGHELEIVRAADGLRYIDRGGPPRWLDPLGADRLRLRSHAAELVFPAGPGRPAHVEWIGGGARVLCPRIAEDAR